MTETSTTATDEAPATAHLAEARPSRPAGSPPPSTAGAKAATDRRARWAIVVCFAFLYAFFFQGGGWNQNTRFDTMRALVEHGTFEIAAYAHNTGDVAEIDGRVYANKAPGLAILGAPVYAVVLAANRALGLDPDDPGQIDRNAWAVTIGVNGSAVVAVLLLLYGWFRREGATQAEALLLVMAFGAGSLLFPYSGVLMSHAVSALLLLAPWLLLERGATRAWHWHAAGWMLGLGITVEFLAAPAAAICLVWAIAQRPPPRTLAALFAGCAIPVAGLLLHNLLCFGGPFVTNYSVQSTQFRDTQLMLGVFHWPELQRVYWLSVHPYRGLFYASPVLLLPLASAFIARGGGRPRLGTLAALGIIASYVLFNLGFNGWTGGYCVGPRYLVPITPLIFLFALPALRQAPRFALALACVSAAFMFAVTSVDVMVPGPNSGPPPASDPIARSLVALATGDVALNRQGFASRRREGEPADRGATNLGMSLGLSGTASVVPAAAWLLLWAGWMRRHFRVSDRNAPSPADGTPEPPISTMGKEVARDSSDGEALRSGNPARATSSRERAIAFCVLVGAGTAFVFPMLISGTLPPGDDLPFALQLTRSVAEALEWGMPWPRWVDEMNASLGGPALAVYPPLGAWLGGLLSFLSGSLVAGMQATAWLGAVAAAFAFAYAVSPWCRLRTAVFAGALYVLLPYHFVDQYPRFAAAETLAFVFVPLVFRFARTLALGGGDRPGGAASEADLPPHDLRRQLGRLGLPAVALAFSAAALLLTHTLTAALVALALVVYVGVLLWRSPPRNVSTRSGALIAAGLLAAALAAFQLGPMLAERSNLQIEALTAVEHGALARNFLFRDETTLGFTPSHIKPFVEAATIPTALLALAAATLALRRRERPGAPGGADPIRREVLCMGATGVAVLFLQLPASAWLWRALPVLESVQFPWRFGVVLSLATAWLFACLGERWLDEPAFTADAPTRPSQQRDVAERGIVGALVLWAVVVGFHASTARGAPPGPTWFEAPQLRERIVPEYLPPDVSADAVARWARSRPSYAPAWTLAPASVEAKPVAPGRRAFRVRADAEVDLFVSTFAHPRWRAFVDASPVAIVPDAPLPLLRITLPPGDHRVELEFGPGPVDTVSGVVTGVALLTCGGVGWAARRSRDEVACMTSRSREDDA